MTFGPGTTPPAAASDKSSSRKQSDGGPTVAWDSLIAFVAFRYALGRTSYVVGHVGDWLIANRDKLCTSYRGQILREIKAAADSTQIGMDMDRLAWMRVAVALTDKADPNEPAGVGAA